MSDNSRIQKKLKSFGNTWVETPTIFQMEATECGAASLGMILAYFGCNVPLEQLRIDCGVSRNGSTAGSIMTASERYGLECHGYRRETDDLLKMETPCIIHWRFVHFVVYEGIKHGKIYINDPASGRTELTYDELDESFTGIVLSFKTTDKFVKREKQDSILHLIKQRTKNQKSAIIALFLYGLILVVPGLIIPIFSKVFVDSILLGGNTSWTFALLVFMVCTVFFQAIFSWLRSTTLVKLSAKISLTSNIELLNHLFKLPISFFEQRFSGELVKRIDNNNSVNEFISGELAQTILNVFVAIFYLVLLLFYSPFLTLIGCIGLTINVVANSVVSKRLKELTLKNVKDSGNYYGVLFSGIKMTDSLKAAGAERKFVSRVLGHYASNINSEQRIVRANQVMSSIPPVVSKIFDIAILMFGAKIIIEGNMTIGDLTAFTTLMGSFAAPINSLASFFTRIQTLKADIDRVEDTLNYEVAPQFKVTEFDEQFDKLSGNCELNNISYGYNPLAAPVIKDFNMKIKAGHSVALVGASGSGKSTVGKLISGLNDAWSGDVLFDGKRIRDIDPLFFTSSVSTVSQEVFVFAGTIKDNITLWNNQVKNEDIIQAAKDACIHDDILKKENAYEELLEENGTNLSGGQRQRIEIARALVNNPSLLILDEATSALDPIVEEKVINNIKKRGCACVIIAHRLSTIRDCDEIIVLDHGTIAERGNHEELLKNKGIYYELIKTM